MGWGGVVACLIIVSTPGPDFAKVKARFGQVGDEVQVYSLKKFTGGGVVVVGWWPV